MQTLRSPDELKREELEKQYQALEKQYQELSQQLSFTINAGDRVQLDMQLEDVYQRIQKINDEIKQLEPSQPDYNQYDKHWQDKLHCIDFSEARKDFKDIIDKLRNIEKAAFFLLQDSFAMQGRLCVRCILEELNMTNIPLKRYEPIGFLKPQDVNPNLFLSRLGEQLKIKPLADIEKYSQLVIETICNSYIESSIIFLELNISQTDNKLPDFFNWLIKDFWSLLLGEISKIKNQKFINLRVVIVMTLDDQVSKEILLEYKTTKQKFSCEKIFELKLKKWKQEEIENWLLDHSRLTAFIRSEDIKQDIEQIAKFVYKHSKGKPSEASVALMGQLTRALGGSTKM
ncbi:hypothetical protein WA1_07415 [Scytonema hofmannii PCC 7110]|uniref:Effector-associated domain-containing protein n=1 Tax=Scytonema hofmannii PCC 7110 TaxID=128403 RepID=A0A139WTA6_9CYAN|nr:hypothetical protein [Scytonema hofmannii]KYC35637.1 hypothetical protein WA1_07415 [Scytonema hofmannii PCC 7110]